jgi:hypothetical protein
MKLGKKPVPVEIRFWNFVRKTKYCWNWTGQKLPAGYGMIKESPSRKNVYAHHLSWKIHYGEITGNLFVPHKCDNPNCVNPKHLFLGTSVDNMRDCSNKGRIKGCSKQSWHGELSPVAKLNWNAVDDIRTSSLSLSKLAKRYNVIKATIWKVKTNRIWKKENRYVD